MDDNSLNIKIIIAVVGLFIATVTIIGNWIATKVIFGEKIKSHEIRLNKHSIKLNEIDDELKLKQTLVGCGEWRKEMEKNMDRLEKAFSSQVSEIRRDFRILDEKEEKRTARIFEKLDDLQKDYRKFNGKG